VKSGAKKETRAFRLAGKPWPVRGIRPNAVAYILVGGASSRFGSDKALAELDGRPMYLRMNDLFPGHLLKTRLVGDPRKYGDLGIECIADLWPGEGPLGGIVTALRHSETAAAADFADFNIIVSCDMPFLTKDWIESLLTRAFNSDAQVVLPRSRHGLEPLCAVWSTKARVAVEKQFQKGTRKVTEAIANLTSEVLDESDWKRFDTHGRLFWNMNSQADYEEAKKMVEAEKKQVAWRFKYPR